MTDNDLFDPNVPLACLRLNGGTRSRAAMDDPAIAEYTEAIRHGAAAAGVVLHHCLAPHLVDELGGD